MSTQSKLRAIRHVTNEVPFFTIRFERLNRQKPHKVFLFFEKKTVKMRNYECTDIADVKIGVYAFEGWYIF